MPDANDEDQDQIGLTHVNHESGDSNEQESSGSGRIRDPSAVSERLPAESAQGDVAEAEGEGQVGQAPLPGVDEPITVRTLEAVLEQQVSWSGPMPDPQTLGQYEQVLPGLADRMMRSVESQAVDASKRDDRIANAEIKVIGRGQGWAIFLAFGCIVTAVVFFALGNNTAGLALLGLPLIGLIGSFLPKSK